MFKEHPRSTKGVLRSEINLTQMGILRFRDCLLLQDEMNPPTFSTGRPLAIFLKYMQPMPKALL